MVKVLNLLGEKGLGANHGGKIPHQRKDTVGMVFGLVLLVVLEVACTFDAVGAYSKLDSA